MAKEEVIIQNFSGGELSPQMYGRYELAVFKSGCRRLRNFVAETQGSGRFRTGFRVVHYTRQNKVAFPITFQFNNEQAYELEFTDKKIRFYKDEGIIVETAVVVTGLTSASPGVVTAAAHGYATGDEVLIEGVNGFVNINGEAFTVVVLSANTFSLKDIDGTAVNTTSLGTYISGGTVSRIYEISTPYDENLDLTQLKVTQNADTMYIDHPFYDPRKLTRSGHTSWTLSRYSRTADPFLDKKVISGVTQASPGNVHCVGHGYSTGDIIIIEEVEGMVELNSRVYTVVKIGADNFSLKDYITGVAVNTTGYTAYSANGFASDQTLLPACPSFHEGRLYHGGMTDNPTQFIGSRSPVPATGVPRYEDYTAGANPDDAVYFSIADGEVNHIEWLIGTNRLLMAGTFGTEVKITGDTVEKPITPSSVNVRAENRLGVASLTPINKENIVIYVQRGGLTLRTFEYDALNDRFVSTDRNLVSEHITYSGIKQMTWQSGRPDLVWAVRNDGKLLGLTFKSGESISGWHIHTTGGSFSDKFLGVASMPRPDAGDQLWAVTERVINGHTRRFMEFMEDPAIIPDFFDFYTGDDNYDDDIEVFKLAMLEAQKEYLHLDCAVTYDGLSRGNDATSTITPSAATGNSITITSNNNVFLLADVGREIWKKAVNGVGEGRAKILSYINAKNVVCQVLSDFDSVAAMAPGYWYLTTNALAGLKYLEGRAVGVVVDGGVHTGRTVSSGQISLDYQASKVHVGLLYPGYLEPMTVEAGGTTGPAQAKNKIINRVGVRFLNTLGVEVGTNPYDAELVQFSQMPLNLGSPQLLFSGIKDVILSDSWDMSKTVFIRQTNPLPCTVQLLECWDETDNDGS